MQKQWIGVLRWVALGLGGTMLMLGNATGTASDNGICFGEFPTFSCTLGLITDSAGNAPPCSPETVTLCDASAVADGTSRGVAIVGDCFEGFPGSSPDVIIGSNFRNVVNAGRDNNTVCAGEGDDIVIGSWGDDTIAGEDGNDVLYGGGGRDALAGGPGNDTLVVSGNLIIGSPMDAMKGGERYG